MANDIFGRRALVFGGAFAADSARIELALQLECTDEDDEVVPCALLTQQLNIQYQQPIQRLYEVGTQKTYYVAGRPQGTATIARVLGPGAVMAELYESLGNVCNATANDMCFCVQSGCLNEDIPQEFQALQLGIKNVVLQSLGFSIQAQDMIINEQMSLFFTALMANNPEAGCQFTEDEDVTPDCFT